MKQASYIKIIIKQYKNSIICIINCICLLFTLTACSADNGDKNENDSYWYNKYGITEEEFTTNE